MRLVEKIFWLMIFGTAIPVMLFLAFWWLSIGRVQDNQIFIVASVGLIIGIIIDLVIIKIRGFEIYNIKYEILALIHIFYSICIFGFFMGVPIFNVIPAIVAGFYLGRRIKYQDENHDQIGFEVNIDKLQNFCLAVLILACIASSALALIDKSTGANIKGMLNLQFEVTTPVLLAIIFAGGLILITTQYLLTQVAAKIAFGKPRNSEHIIIVSQPINETETFAI